MAIIFDLETDGFLEELTKIHCNVIYDTDKHDYETYDPEQGAIIDSIHRLREAECIIGHNIISFDIPTIKKLFPDFEVTGNLIDTYVWAACAFPNIKDIDWGLYRKGLLPASLIGKHTLESYGYRLGVYKGVFGKTTDWQKWTPEMSEYCKQDVTVTKRLVEKLTTKNVPEEQLDIEHQVYEILTRQMRHGILFDIKAAEALYVKLSDKREKLREKIQNTFPPFYKRKGKQFTPKRNNKAKGYIVGATCQHIELTEFNPNSAIHIARMLMIKYNWIPTDFADKQSPSLELQFQYDRLGIFSNTIPTIDDEILKRLPYPEAKPLAKFQLLQKRCAQLGEGREAWLNHYNKETGRIYGVINQFGTVTGRCNHFKPNLGQVVAAHHPWGKEFRSLFTVPKGFKLVGVDADGLEARCKAHYLARYDNKAFIETILKGKKADGTDTHSLNCAILGIKSRDIAKTWYYAWMYGSGDANLGLVAMEDENYKDYSGEPAALGKKLRAALADKFAGVKQLVKAVQKKARKQKFLRGLDGRKIPIRAIYSALNALFQSAGAVIMKKAICIADDLIQAKGLVPGKDYEQLLFVHDELQWEVIDKMYDDSNSYPEIVAECGREAIRLAGEALGVRCPLSGSSKIGNSWCDTH